MRTIWLIGMLLLSTIIVQARTIAVGTLSFDIFLPGTADDPGVNIFSIANLTGDPMTGGFALPPDFPALTPVTFLDARLAVAGDVNQEFALGDLPPGFYTPFELAFPETLSFSAAAFTATIDPLSLLLSDGTTFVPASRTVQIELRRDGAPLAPGVDAALIVVSDVPEPAQTIPLAFFSAAAAIYALRRR